MLKLETEIETHQFWKNSHMTHKIFRLVWGGALADSKKANFCKNWNMTQWSLGSGSLGHDVAPITSPKKPFTTSARSSLLTVYVLELILGFYWWLLMLSTALLRATFPDYPAGRHVRWDPWTKVFWSFTNSRLKKTNKRAGERSLCGLQNGGRICEKTSCPLSQWSFLNLFFRHFYCRAHPGFTWIQSLNSFKSIFMYYLPVLYYV